jgi:putative tryptophan/tyrosine transport system substrate-binding protein
MPDGFTSVHRDTITELTARHHVPAIYPFRYFAASGGLVSYGVDSRDIFRRAASYVDRILKGESPSELPVQAPTKFEFVINLKTATALGLTVPPSLLARAAKLSNEAAAVHRGFGRRGDRVGRVRLGRSSRNARGGSEC